MDLGTNSKWWEEIAEECKLTLEEELKPIIEEKLECVRVFLMGQNGGVV